MSRQYYVINALNGAVQIITSKSRYKVAEKAKRIFGNAPLHIYARQQVISCKKRINKVYKQCEFKSVSHTTFTITMRK